LREGRHGLAAWMKVLTQQETERGTGVELDEAGLGAETHSKATLVLHLIDLMIDRWVRWQIPCWLFVFNKLRVLQWLR